MSPLLKAKVYVVAALCLAATATAGAQAPKPEKIDNKTNTVPPEFREMQEVEDRWDASIAKRDQFGLELVLAPQFIGISAAGDVSTRNQQMAQLFQKNTLPESLEQKVIDVRFVGEVAIVNGTYVMTWKGEKAPLLEKGVFSHVFEHVHGNWLCLNSQRTVVAEESKGSPAAVQKSKGKTATSSQVPPVFKSPVIATPAPPQ